MSETKRFLQLLVQTLLLWSDILRNEPLTLILIMSKTKPVFSTSQVRSVPAVTSACEPLPLLHTTEAHQADEDDHHDDNAPTPKQRQII